MLRLMGSQGKMNSTSSYSTILISSGLQFSSVAQSCPTLFDPMNRSTPGLPVHHHLPEFTQTHVHQSVPFLKNSNFPSVQFSSVTQSCLTLCDPMNRSMPGLPVHHQLRFTSIESVMPSSHLILCRPLLLLPQSLPASESLPMSQLFT